MRERISELLKSKGLTANKFAEIIEIQPSGLSHILNGRNKPGFDFIVRTLERFPEVNPDWLLLGKGAMYRDRKNENINNPTTLFEAEQESVTTDEIILKHDQSDIITKVSNNNSERIPATKIIILNSDKTAQIFEIKD